VAASRRERSSICFVCSNNKVRTEPALDWGWRLAAKASRIAAALSTCGTFPAEDACSPWICPGGTDSQRPEFTSQLIGAVFGTSIVKFIGEGLLASDKLAARMNPFRRT
jgi:hypothetical protein